MNVSVLTAISPVDGRYSSRVHTLRPVVSEFGLMRARIEVEADADKAAIEAQAFAAENVQRHTEGKTVRKVIVVPDRLVNLVV